VLCKLMVTLDNKLKDTSKGEVQGSQVVAGAVQTYAGTTHI